MVTAHTQNNLYTLNPHQEIGNFSDNLRLVYIVKVKNQYVSINFCILQACFKIFKIDP